MKKHRWMNGAVSCYRLQLSWLRGNQGQQKEITLQFSELSFHCPHRRSCAGWFYSLFKCHGPVFIDIMLCLLTAESCDELASVYWLHCYWRQHSWRQLYLSHMYSVIAVIVVHSPHFFRRCLSKSHKKTIWMC